MFHKTWNANDILNEKKKKNNKKKYIIQVPSTKVTA